MFCAPNQYMGRVGPTDGSVSLHNGISLTQERECSVHSTHAWEELNPLMGL